MARAIKIRRLRTKLLLARRHVRILEHLLYLAEREQAARCKHRWVMNFPDGPRDNGELSYVCDRCSTQHGWRAREQQSVLHICSDAREVAYMV